MKLVGEKEIKDTVFTIELTEAEIQLLMTIIGKTSYSDYIKNLDLFSQSNVYIKGWKNGRKEMLRSNFQELYDSLVGLVAEV